MKVSLGKIAICPKGKYSSSEKYTKLDLVSYSGVGWVCRKDCQNITPCECDNWQSIGVSGENSSIVIDNVLSSTSTNPVQNKIITDELKKKAVDITYVDDTLSLIDVDGNILKSVTIKQGEDIIVDTTLSETSKNPVENQVVTNELSNKAESFTYENNVFTLTGKDGKVIKSATIQSNTNSNIVVDSELSDTSENAVQNKIIKKALDSKVGSVDGMGLSHNDFTDEYKNTVDNLSILNDDITVYFSSEKICQGVYDNPTSDGTKENPYISIANFTKYTSIPRNLNGHTLTLRFKPNENFSGFNENVGAGLYGGVESLNEFYNGIIYIAKDQDSKGCISFSYAYFKDIRCALVIDCSDDMEDSSITKVGIKFKSLEFKDCKDVRIYPNSGNQGLLNISGLFSSYNSKVTVYWVWLQASQITAESGSIISIGGYVSLSGTGTQRLNARSSIIMIREIYSTLIDGTTANNASTNWSASYGGRIYIGSQTNLGNY